MPRSYQSLSLQNRDDSCRWCILIIADRWLLKSHYQATNQRRSTAKQPNSQSSQSVVLGIITLSALSTIWSAHSLVSAAYLSIHLRASFLKPLFFHFSWSLRCTCSSSNSIFSGLSLIDRNSHSYLKNPNSYPLHYEWLRYILFCYESGARYLWLGHF